MSREQARAAVEAGIEVAAAEIEKGVELLATGDMGIGNTTPSTAILAAFTGFPAFLITGRGPGLIGGPATEGPDRGRGSQGE